MPKLLEGFPTLTKLVTVLDAYLKSTHPEYFGKTATHPFAPLKQYKVIHDNLWGTNRFSWRELAIIDCPILQRLRGIHQTGLAHYVYPCAHHTRFEHSLGVATVASRIFDALTQRHVDDLSMIGRAMGHRDVTDFTGRLREELRLAALLHDTGHSIHSHTSEHVYGKLPLMEKAVEELSTFVGRKKGAGEVISFCLSRTDSIKDLLSRAEKKLSDSNGVRQLDMDNVSLLIVGRSKHPYLQFMADIISSDLDADKLDYLLRDAGAAGLPLKYDLERYLYTVGIAPDLIPDGEGNLQKLYDSLGTKAKTKRGKYPSYEAYQLRLPKQAMSTIEQIVICKFMLFSYIYHHRKVRAGEGMLAKSLNRWAEKKKKAGNSDEKLVCAFLDLVDSGLDGASLAGNTDVRIKDYIFRIRRRLLPREVFDFVASSFSHAEGALLSDFISVLLDPQRRSGKIKEFEDELGKQLLKLDPKLGKSTEEALWKTGSWLDVPKPPKFENVDLLIGSSSESVPLSDVFPIQYWIQAYESHRYHVRVFAFSEYENLVRKAARQAAEKVIKIKSASFYKAVERRRIA